MKVKIGTTVEEQDVERLEALARESDVSLAWLLRKILREYLIAQEAS